jgi:adenylosuccinate lyase
MVRDQGTHRQPAVSLTIGSGLVFALCCYVLHRREQNLRNNVAEAASGSSGGAVVPVGTPD